MKVIEQEAEDRMDFPRIDTKIFRGGEFYDLGRVGDKYPHLAGTDIENFHLVGQMTDYGLIELKDRFYVPARS